VLHVTGGVGVEAHEFFGHYAAMLGRGMRSLPSVAAAVLTAPVDAVSRSLGWHPPLPTRALEYLTHPGTYSVDKAARLVGWTPRIDLDAGMARTRDWLVDTGLVPAPAPPD
jgi:2-alkyl-3-oxoalkanoate reductase